MLSEEKRKQHPCSYCIRGNCVNRGNKDIANKERTCYEMSKCGECAVQYLCKNTQKGKLRKNAEETFSMEACFVAPRSCKECNHIGVCKNSGLGIQFELDLSKSSDPLCFGTPHSTR